MVDALLEDNFFKQKDVKVLSQSNCTHSLYIDSSYPSKLCFLKNLFQFAKLLRLEIVENVLLVDDSPQKNLLNDVHSIIHPLIWSSNDENRFITIQL